MSFFNSAWLWAAGAIVIPVAIHLWNARKGKPMPWATIQFLQEKENQTSRGLQLDHILLLVLRCLILIIIAFLLAEPIQNAIYTDNTISKIHLVAPSNNVVEDFRFELTQAQEQNEEIYWLNTSADAVSNFENIPVQESEKLDLQKHIDVFAGPNVELHFYLENDLKSYLANNYFIHSDFKIFLSENAESNRAVPSIQFAENSLLVEGNSLISKEENSLPANVQILHQGPIYLKIENIAAEEEELLKSAIAAISDVYAMEFVFEADRNPDLVFANSLPEDLNQEITYVLLHEDSLVIDQNVFQLRLPENQSLETGQLPEEILQLIVNHFGIDWRAKKLSNRQFASLFSSYEKGDENRKKPEWPILLLLLCVGAERIVALNRNR